MRFLFAALALCSLAAPAHSEPWKVGAAQSQLTFTGAQAKQPFEGSFSHFEPVIEFDPAHPEKGSIHVTIDMASAHIDNKEQNDALPTEDWFFTSQFPQAEFASTAIHATGKNQFAVDGTLTLRGVAKKITLPFTLTPTGANGEVTLDRRDFVMGGSQWKDDKWIAYPVTVRYCIAATPH